MKRYVIAYATIALISAFLLGPSNSLAQDNAENSETTQAEKAVDDSSFISGVLLYLPNRVFDALDIFRARVRVGPGFNVGARVTEPLSANIGSYTTLFAGLPGPRGKPALNLPFGAELYSGAQLSVMSVETENFGPSYGSTEVGANIQLLMVGFAVGVDPVELFDFIFGFVGIDIRDDDL